MQYLGGLHIVVFGKMVIFDHIYLVPFVWSYLSILSLLNQKQVDFLISYPMKEQL